MRVLFLAAGVLSFPVALFAAPPEPWTIVPGQGIGRLRLGMTVQEAIAVLGAPTTTWGRPGMNTVLLWFDPRDAKKTNQGGLFATGVPSAVVRESALVHADVVITVGVVLDPRYTTTQGLHTGVPERDVIAALGSPRRVIGLAVDMLEGKFDPNIRPLQYGGLQVDVRDGYIIQIVVRP